MTAHSNLRNQKFQVQPEPAQVLSTCSPFQTGIGEVNQSADPAVQLPMPAWMARSEGSVWAGCATPPCWYLKSECSEGLTRSHNWWGTIWWGEHSQGAVTIYIYGNTIPTGIHWGLSQLAETGQLLQLHWTQEREDASQHLPCVCTTPQYNSCCVPPAPQTAWKVNILI